MVASNEILDVTSSSKTEALVLGLVMVPEAAAKK